jgi:S-adenosylmethionine:tRNA ribosyltransferase-isomerase
MRISDYDYELPTELIAQRPLENRDASRMLLVDRGNRTFRDARFSQLDAFMRGGDLLVLNNTKVFPARLVGRTETGARVEVFLVRDLGGNRWEALAKPLRRLGAGKRLSFGERLPALIAERTAEGRVVVEFGPEGDLREIIDEVGRTPLPPYIKRENTGRLDADRERYQTVFARSSGAVAAPTAGLHFTNEVFARLRDRGIEIAEVTLHVGYGTFEPVRVEELSQHRVLPESYEIGEAAAEALSHALSERRRIIAVGTTTTRTLENCVSVHGRFVAESASAELTITPGYKFKAINGLLTNFHLPKSSLLVLVSTFGGHELIMDAYRHAVAEKYRFYSYGDCMFIS